MSDEGFRVATKVPWDADRPPSWGRLFKTEQAAINEVIARARPHQGKGYKLRKRGDQSFGPKRTLADLPKRIGMRLNATFGVGDVLIIWDLKDDTQWFIRKVQVAPAIIDVSTGNDGIDINHTLIFGQAGRKLFPNAESWGILVKRHIDGTNIWSQHSPWHEDACTSNAEDFHAPSLQAMKDLATYLVNNGKVSKMLLAGEEWLPESGWRFVGSYLDHYDHLHCEPLPTRHSLC